tara:strand:- start:338 stop:835 length:498 start_codon:yes stop_codon:yes gene_type:complete
VSLLNNRSSLFKWFLLAGLIFLLDQWVKFIIIENISLYERFKINDFINITHQRNPGAAFSFLADAGGWQRWFLSTIAIVVCLYIVYWLKELEKENKILLPYGLSFVLGGALGNLFDRIMLGYVTDYIQVLIFGWPFPSFNVADAAISIGAVLIIVDAIKNGLDQT